MSERIYKADGWAYLVCPQLLAIDQRHGTLNHPQVAELPAGDNHDVNLFVWAPGSRPPTPSEWPICRLCGERLVRADGEHPYRAATVPSDRVG